VAGVALYGRAVCYLHPDAAAALARAQALAAALDLRFLVFDGFRPVEAQRALFAHCPDPEFVSHPQTGAVPHCRGVAVDLTLVDRAGQPLEMGTPFDSFAPQSHHGRTDISPQAQRNRAVLLGLMTAAGWDFYSKEWWHYQLFQPRRYPILSDSVLPLSMLPDDGIP